jgi:polyisoprenoid-binding protein YceI
MSNQYTLGPDDGTLTVRTGKTGAAAKAGHNLLIEVTSWKGELALGDDGTPSSVTLTADPTSLRVLEGTGGIQSLGDEEKDSIRQTIAKDVLKDDAIEFRSRAVTREQGSNRVDGELQLRGKRNDVSFELALGDDGKLTASARFKQTDWGMKPYSALFGTLKVVDEVEVSIDAQLPQG